MGRNALQVTLKGNLKNTPAENFLACYK